MKTTLTLAGAILITAALAACSPGVNTLGNSITFDSNGIVVHALGHPDAHIGRDGGLSIDGNAVTVTPAQQQLLKHYYLQARDVMDSGKAVGKQGVQMATHSIGAAVRAIFHGDSSSADKQLDTQSQSIEAAADALCDDVNALGATQKTLADQIPAFKPYASSDQVQCKITRTTTYAAGRKVTSTSRSYSMQADAGSDASMRHETSRQTGKTNDSDSSASSQP